MPTSLQVPHDLHKAVSVSDWLDFSFQYGKNESNPKEAGCRGRPKKNQKGVQAQTRKVPTPKKALTPKPVSGEVVEEKQAATQVYTEALVHAAVEAPYPWCDGEDKGGSVHRLEEVGQSPKLSPTQQLAQMATEAGPSMSAEGEPARRKLQTYSGGKAPRKEFLKAGVLKMPLKYWQGIVVPQWDLAIPEEHRTPHMQVPLFTCSLQDRPRNLEDTICMLPGAHYNGPAGSCRSLFSEHHGRWQPPCMIHMWSA